MISNKIITVLAIGFSALAISAVQAKTFVYCSEGSPEGFDPGLYTSGTTFDAAAYPIYNRLLEFTPGTSNVIPALAKSWTISDDGKQYTFKLRSGVKFQTTSFFKPTRTLNADDVIFSFERQIRADHPWNKYVKGAAWDYADSMDFPKIIQKIEKIDDLTVKFTLSRAEGPFLADIAMPFAVIMSKEYADSLAKSNKKEQLNQKPLGTGPYTFVAYQQDSVIRYKANPDYWEGKQKVDLVFAITPDASVRYQKLKKGECHLMPYPNIADVKAMANDKDIKLEQREGLNVAYIAFNTTQKPFDNVKVRQALNMAVNKIAIIDAVFQNQAITAKNPIPPTIWSYNDAVKDYKFDLVKAKKMLADAGVKDLKLKLWAMPVSRPYMLNARRTAEIIQADFAKIGITTEIVSYEWAEYLNRVKRVDRDGIAIAGWTGDNGDPDNFMDTLLSCEAVGTNNYSVWCNKEFNNLVKKAKITADKAERTKLYQQAQVVFKREAPWIPLVHSTVTVPMRKEVKGFVVGVLGDFAFKGVDLVE